MNQANVILVRQSFRQLGHREPIVWEDLRQVIEKVFIVGLYGDGEHGCG